MANDSPNLLKTLLVRRCRQLGLTQSEVAERAHMTRAYLQRLCIGETTNPGIKTLDRLAQALQMPASAVFRLFLASTGDPLRAQQCHLGLPVAKGGLGDDDALAFVADVSVPDHSVMLPNERFTKTWAIQNSGHVAWKGRCLARADERFYIGGKDFSGRAGSLMASHLNSLEDKVDIPETLPGQMVEMSVDFAAPKESCSVASVWQVISATGQPCYGPGCYLQVIVTVLGV